MSSANLPPTLAKSQVSSVRKNLKIHLVAVLKHPCSLDFQAQISTLLLDLGMPQSEITRATPLPREPRKRPRNEQYPEGKKIKMGEWSDDGEDQTWFSWCFKVFMYDLEGGEEIWVERGRQ